MTRSREITPLGIEIKKKLLDRHMSQLELAKKVGTSQSYITDIIHGRYPFIRSYVLEEILNVLEIKEFEIEVKK